MEGEQRRKTTSHGFQLLSNRTYQVLDLVVLGRYHITVDWCWLRSAPYQADSGRIVKFYLLTGRR